MVFDSVKSLIFEWGKKGEKVEIEGKKKGIVFDSLAGAMVARLPTEQEVVGSTPTSGFYWILILILRKARVRFSAGDVFGLPQ